MSVRLTAVVVSACLCTAVAAQTPDLPKPQRELLAAMIAAVDAAGSDAETDNAGLRTHVLRASDGSHYVAFSVAPPPASPLPSPSPVLYIRLATASAIPSQRPERSLVREWLAGTRAAPPRAFAQTGIALGEMPIMGPAGSAERRPPLTQQMADLNVLDLERRRAREREMEVERQRRAENEGRSKTASETLPFEDFDFATSVTAGVIQRALTTGPGDFFLYVAWADSASPQPAASVRVVKKRLTLPAASTTELTIGSVILADRIQPRATAYGPGQQASHPYTIGLTEIVPAADAIFADAENLSAVFQVINPQPADRGKPDVDVAFQVVRVVNNQEQAVAALTPQNYSAANLPAEFDARLGHPLFATVSAPLATLKRGNYRLKILVNDKVGGRTATTDADFTVTATAAALLRDAPPLGAPFRREAVLSAEVLPGVLAALRPASPSAALQRAFDLASAGRFVDLMVMEPVPQAEDGVRTALGGLALFAVGDGSSAVQFQRAQLLGAPLAPSRFLSGAARAMQSRDADAIAAWQDALTAGAPRALVVPFLREAYLRRNDFPRAAALIDGGAATGAWSRSTAAVLIATQKERDAIRLIDARLAASPADLDAQWLLLHALFAQLARDPQAAGARERFAKQARAYIDGKGPNTPLAEEWLGAVTSSQ